MNANVTAARRLLEVYGANVREARQECGVSLDVFAKVCGLDAPALSRIERGRLVPEDRVVLSIADALFSHVTDRTLYPVLFGTIADSGVGHARFTDPDQSDMAVKAAQSLRPLVVEYARERWPHPFDVRDLVAWVEARHPRRDGEPWQRGTWSQTVGRAVKAGVLVDVYRTARLDRKTPTNHYLYNKETA